MAATGARSTEVRLPQFNPIQLRLDRSNYAFWRVLVLSAIRGQGLENFISPTAVVPMPLLPGPSNGAMVPNPEYVDWIKRDQCLMSWMLSTVSESMLGHVVRSRSACEVWIGLERAVYAQSKSQTMKFRKQLQSTKKGDLSVEDYFMKMRAIADQLAAIGKPLDDDELLMHILEGFGPEYEALVVNTMQRSDVQDLQEVQLAFQHMRFVFLSNTPLFWNTLHMLLIVVVELVIMEMAVVVLALEEDMLVLHLLEMVEVSNRILKVFAAEYVGGVDQICDGEGGNWCVDSGATTHVTNDMQNLAVSSNYVGAEGLMVGNGFAHSQDLAEGEPL